MYMNKIASLVAELLLLAVGLYALITILGEMAGYYTIGGGYGQVQLFFLAILLLNSVFYILIRVGIESKKIFWFFIPAAIYFLIMTLGPSAWFSGPFLQSFLALGIVGLLFIALPISILLTLRYIFLKFLAQRKQGGAKKS